MKSAVQAAARLRAINTGPVLLANTGRGLEVIRAVIGTARQALIHLLIDLIASFALPARLAITLAGDTGAVTAAVGVGTVGCKSRESRIARRLDLALCFRSTACFVASTGRSLKASKTRIPHPRISLRLSSAIPALFPPPSLRPHAHITPGHR